MDNHIELRQFDIEKDLPFFHKAHSDADSMRFYGMNEFKSIDDSRKLMMEYIASEQDKKSIHRVICNSQNKEYMGGIGISNIHPIHHRADAYCILLPEYRKKGVSVEASVLLYRNVFEQLHINRIQALVDSRNENARKSLIGIGFIYEGTLHQYEFENGEYIDIEVFSLTKSQFYVLYGFDAK
jgi:ribosomal-protein-alanine N-acetyltransferase